MIPGQVWLEPGSFSWRDRGAPVRVVRTCGEGAVQAGSLWGPFPARSAPSGWDRQAGKKRGHPDGERPGGPGGMQRPRQMNDQG